jgi:hypothetical protein
MKEPESTLPSANILKLNELKTNDYAWMFFSSPRSAMVENEMSESRRLGDGDSKGALGERWGKRGGEQARGGF